MEVPYKDPDPAYVRFQLCRERISPMITKMERGC